MIDRLDTSRKILCLLVNDPEVAALETKKRKDVTVLDKQSSGKKHCGQ
jgi:hypothetical protein